MPEGGLSENSGTGQQEWIMHFLCNCEPSDLSALERLCCITEAVLSDAYWQIRWGRI